MTPGGSLFSSESSSAASSGSSCRSGGPVPAGRLGPVPAGRLGWAEILLILPALIPLFINLGLTSMWKSEGRWISIASNMLKTGDWLEPELDGSFYGDKPLLSYWAIALLASLLGRLDEQIARLPSALAGAATVFVTAWMAARLLGRRQAAPAAWILATAYSFFFWSRAASADLLSLVFGTGAVAVYLESTIGFRPWQPFLFFTLIALGGQSKGMPAVIVPIGIAIAHRVLAPLNQALSARRGWRDSLRSIWPRDRAAFLRKSGWAAAGVVLGTALYALPFVASRVHRGDWGLLSFMWRENFVRALDAFDHRAPVFYYLYMLPLMFLPWSPWLVGALFWAGKVWAGRVWAGKGLRSNPGLVFALTAFLVIFCAFTASESRRSYYILPIFPFAAILVAGFWAEIPAHLDSGASPGRVWRILALVPCAFFEGALALGLLFVLAGPILPKPLGALWRILPHPFVLAAMAGLGLGGILLSHRRAGLRGRFLATAATAILVCFWLSTDLETLRAERISERHFAEEVKSQVGGSEILCFRTRDPTLLYYLGQAPRVTSPEEVLRILAEGRAQAFVVCKKEDLVDLTGFAPLETVEVIPAGKDQDAAGSLIKGEDRYFLIRCRMKGLSSPR